MIANTSLNSPDSQSMPTLVIDKYALHKLNDFCVDVNAAYGAYNFNKAHSLIMNFINFLSLYFEMAKDRLYADPINSTPRQSALCALSIILHSFTQRITPILCFTAEEAFEKYKQNLGLQGDSISSSTWTSTV